MPLVILDSTHPGPGRVGKIGMWLERNIEESDMKDKLAIVIPDSSGLVDVNELWREGSYCTGRRECIKLISESAGASAWCLCLSTEQLY